MSTSNLSAGKQRNESMTLIVEQIFGANKAPLDVVLAADFGDLEREVSDAEARAMSIPSICKSDADHEAIGKFITDMRGVWKSIDGVRLEQGRPLLDAQRGINDFFKSMSSRVERAIAAPQRAADEYVRQKAAEERARREREAAEARRKEDEARAKAEKARTVAAAAKAESQAEVAAARAQEAERAAAASAAELVRSRSGGVTASAKTVWAFSIEDYAALAASMGPLGPFIDRASVEKAIRSVVRVQKGSTALPGVNVFEEVQSTFRR
jgi:hypothetical protein